ncbi:alpha/beta fold hydrolase [Nocardioides montaniterrae]
MTGPTPLPVQVSPELFAPVSPDLELCYQTYGDPADEPLLLVMGLGGPMTWWDPLLCEDLARLGFFVIRFDNRDTGKSTRSKGKVGPSHLVRAFLCRRVKAPYSLSDLAADAFGLLDHLGIDAAHLAGVSMGGMIAQTMAIEAPQRVLSLTSIMSSTGRRSAGWQHPSLIPTLLINRGPSREAYIKGAVKVWNLIGSPGYPTTDEQLAKRAADTHDRGVSQAGVLRQMLAVLTQPDRTADLGRLTMPVSVLHGMDDKMVHISGGRTTAAAVPGAELHLIAGMGHDLPVELHTTFARAIRRTADRATSRRVQPST